ncbi:hypothetical protein C8R44DRAFT_745280 [Mycena epipterygia]|nr:hypothetical protein C8R44DRAFT_745280 [Mycena epipterygia]
MAYNYTPLHSAIDTTATTWTIGFATANYSQLQPKSGFADVSPPYPPTSRVRHTPNINSRSNQSPSNSARAGPRIPARAAPPTQILLRAAVNPPQKFFTGVFSALPFYCIAILARLSTNIWVYSGLFSNYSLYWSAR